jgi:signal transduction histidine kinase
MSAAALRTRTVAIPQYLWSMRPGGRRASILLLAFAMFLGTILLRVVASPQDAVLSLLTVPVALIAFEFGMRGGVIAALIATSWVVIWHKLTLSAIGYFSRGATYLLTAIIVGLFADRLRAAQIAALASQRQVAELQLERQQESNAAAAERERLARELHDVIAHSVSVMTVQATAARRVLAKDPSGAARALEAIERTGRAALTEMRNVIGVLRPETHAAGFGPQPGIDDLERLAELMHGAGLDVQMRIEGKRPHVAAATDLSIYRIAQEALTNTLKHADSRSAEVVVRYHDDIVEIECTDQGTVTPGHANGNSAGHGLMGMRERAMLLGGEVDAGPRQEGGFRVHARLPVEPR